MRRPRALDLFCGAGGAAMGMPWASIAGLSQAIPPAYSEHIGRYAMMALGLEPNQEVS